MGHIFSSEWRTKDDLVQSILRDCTINSMDGTSRVLSHALRGNQLWIAWEYHKYSEGEDPKKIVLLYLISTNQGSYGYKTMDESMGPYYYDCPDHVIKAAGPTTNEYALAWRAKVKEAKAAKKNQKSLRATVALGDVLTFDGAPGQYEVVRQADKDTFGRRVDVANGGIYILPMRRLATVTKPAMAREEGASEVSG